MRAVIYGLGGSELTQNEKNFFEDVDPYGFIVFQRNVDTPEKLQRLTEDLRSISGRADLPILVDQEGGRVARMCEPHWRKAPAPTAFGELYTVNPEAALEAVELNSRLFACEQYIAGINVNCLPMLDVRTPTSNEAVIGDRAYSDDVAAIIALGRAAANGSLRGGVLPVIKHMPGHGRAVVDSHEDVPIVDATIAQLESIDFAPFRALADLPLGMTGHLIYPEIAGDEVSTLSRTIIQDVIRSKSPGRIGFDGLLMTDDLSMGALKIDYASRARGALSAGCDIVLHCNGDSSEMEAVASEIPELSGKSLERAQSALNWLREPNDFDPTEGRNRLQTLMTAQAGQIA
jgi:beta-N-acetylhexosaminidase